MADISNAEVVAKGIIKEAPLPTTLTATDMMAESLRQTLAKGEASEPVTMAAGQSLNEAQADYIINENIGTERDENGKKQNLTTEEITRKTETTSVSEILINYLNRGYDSLTLGQKTEVQGAVLNICKNIPAFESVLSPMNATQQKDYAERIIKDPKYTEAIKKGSLEVFDPTKVQEDNVFKLKLESDRVTTEFNNINTELNTVNARLTQIDTDIKEYQVEIQDGTNLRTGANFEKTQNAIQKVENLRQQISPDLANLQLQEDTISRLENVKKRIMEGKSQETLEDISNQMTTARREVERITSIITPHLLEIKKQDALVKEIQDRKITLEAERKTLSTRKTELETKKKETETTKVQKQTELAKARLSRKQYENKFVSDAEAIFGNAAQEYIESKVKKSEEAITSLLQKEAEKSGEAKVKAIANGKLKLFWDSNGELDKNEIKSLGDEIIANGLLEDSTIRLLLRTGGIIDDTKLDEIMGDTKFINEMKLKVGAEVIKYHLLEGGLFGTHGTLSKDQILKLTSTETGQAMFADAISGNKEAQSKIKELGEHLPAKDKMGEWLKKLDWKKLLLILALILGVTIGMPAIMGATAK